MCFCSGLRGNYTIGADNTTAISYSDGWTQEEDIDKSVNGEPVIDYRQTTVAGASASFTFMGDAVELHGRLNFDHGLYEVVSWFVLSFEMVYTDSIAVGAG